MNPDEFEDDIEVIFEECEHKWKFFCAEPQMGHYQDIFECAHCGEQCYPWEMDE